ncbi:MAG: DNA-directed RNA polymerase [Candidatus Altiarchaeota archaeon]
MNRIVAAEDTVRVPPRYFNEVLEDVVTRELEAMVTGKINKKIGLVLAVNKIIDVSEGKIIHGDGAIYYDVNFEVLAYKPEVHEVVEGSVTEVTEFGVFVNFGPIDGLIHVSQITEDFMSYDQKNSMFIGKESNKSLKQGDMVRARIVTVSMKNRAPDSKIGLTMRQPYLGKLEWIEDDKKQQLKPKDEKPPSKGKKGDAK